MLIILYELRILISNTIKFYKQIINRFNPIFPKNWNFWQHLIKLDSRLYWTCFCQGIIISRKKSRIFSLDWLNQELNSHPFSTYISSWMMANSMITGICISNLAAFYLKKDYQLWQRIEKPIKQFSLALEENSKGAWISKRDLPCLERIILRNLVSIRPITIGTTHAIRVEVTQPIADLLLSSQEQQLHCTVEFKGENLGVLELPIIDGMVSSQVLADAISAEYARQIIGRFFKQTLNQDKQQLANKLIESKLIKSKLVESTNWQQIYDEISWVLFLQELWGITEISDELLKAKNATVQKTVNHDFQDLVTLEVSDELKEIQVNADTINLLVTVGGAAVGIINVATPSKKLTPELVRIAVVSLIGFELCIVAVREGLIGRTCSQETSLRKRLAQSMMLKKNRDTSLAKEILAKSSLNHTFSSNFVPSENILLLGRRSPRVIGTSNSRWAMLPLASMEELKNAALIAGEEATKVLEAKTEIKRILYAPDLIISSSITEGKTDRDTFSPTSALVKTKKLPILMYHHVIPHNLSKLARWKLTPEAFEEQLRYLQENGFYSVTLEDWRIAMFKQKPLPGKAIIITFDDGYLDFFEYAFPLLKKYGFSAMVLLIADQVGDTFDNEAKLMTWQQIKQLQAQGIEFGSHSLTHPSLVTLSYENVVKEGVRSRAILEQELQVPVRTFAYPYGDVNPIIQHLIGACGYDFGLGIGFAHSTFKDPLLRLSRIEIEGGDSLQEFSLKIQQ